jgi:Spy/CpxP family protein refolding chaperone
MILMPSVAVAHPYGGHMMGDDGRYGMMHGGRMYGRDMPMMGMGRGGMMMGMGGCMGMMGGRGPAMMDLSDKQRDQIRDLQRNRRKSNWDLMEKMMDQRDRIADLYSAETLDAKQIGKAYGELFATKRQMIESCIETENRIRGILTDEQRKDYRRMHRGMGPGMMGGMGMMH